MPGEDEQTQTQTQQSKTEPWAAAQPLLTKLLSGYGGLDTGVTTGQRSALDNLSSSVQGIPNFGAQGSDAISKLFSSSTAPQVGMLNDAFAGLNKNIGATASGAELDPYSTPGFADAIARMTGDITKSTKGVYAASGRDPSGAGSFAGSLGRGLTEGIAPTIVSQFNQNKSNQMGAAKSLYDAAGGTAAGTTAQAQVELDNLLKGIGAAPNIGSLYSAPATAQMGAANAQYQQPWTNLAALLNPSTQIAGLGGQTSGNSETKAVQPQSTMGNVIGGASTAIGLLSLLSDERAKENIEEVGELHDGQSVYSYNYKGSDVPQIGLLAQEVAKEVPDAVTPFGNTGLLAVNYARATRRAAEIGRKAA